MSFYFQYFKDLYIGFSCTLWKKGDAIEDQKFSFHKAPVTPHLQTFIESLWIATEEKKNFIVRKRSHDYGKLGSNWQEGIIKEAKIIIWTGTGWPNWLPHLSGKHFQDPLKLLYPPLTMPLLWEINPHPNILCAYFHTGTFFTVLYYLFPCMPFPQNNEQLKKYFVFFIVTVHMSILIKMVPHLQCLLNICWINEWINKLANEWEEVSRLVQERKPGTQRWKNHILIATTIQIF